MAGPSRDYDRVELVWPGKRTEVERVRLPFQTIERVNDAGRARGAQSPMLTGATDLPDWWPDGWRNKLIWGDNKYVLASLLDEFTGKVDLIYIDPPFDTGDDFGVSVLVGEQTARSDSVRKEPSLLEQIAYRDLWRDGVGGWLQHLYDRLIIAKDLLAPSGTIYVHLDWNVGHHARVMMEDMFGAEHSLGEIVWNYGSPSGGRVSGSKLVKAHDVIYAYAKERGAHKYATYYLPYSEKYITEWFKYTDDQGRRYRRRQRRDSSGATYWEKQYLDESRGVPASTVWKDIQQVYADPRAYKAGTTSEITGFRTQKPKALLERIINISSDPGDTVLDFYGGSGTTLVAAEESRRRWIGVELGRFGVHTARKRLLDIPDCRPFEVLNLGRYERRYWQGIEAGDAIHDYYRFILQLFGAQPITGFAHMHGERGGRMVHVGATDAPVTHDELERTLEECAANGITEVDVLGWEWEMGLNPAGKDALVRQYGVNAHLFNIPREVMDKRAVEAGDVHFFELSVVEVAAHVEGSDVDVELTGFLPAVDDYMRQKVGGKVTKWSDWIDYWSVDFDFDGETFINQWQAYRTRKDPKLALRSDPHQYPEPGSRRVVVKVIDIFGNDTTHELAATVGA